jgi:hypothetical protein
LVTARKITRARIVERKLANTQIRIAAKAIVVVCRATP